MDILNKIKTIFKNEEPTPYVAELVSDESVEVKGVLNPSSETWIFVKSYLQKRINELRRDNDSMSLGEIRTAHIRAKIDLCKELIDLGEPEKENEPKEYEDDNLGGFGRRRPN